MKKLAIVLVCVLMILGVTALAKIAPETPEAPPVKTPDMPFTVEADKNNQMAQACKDIRVEIAGIEMLASPSDSINFEPADDPSPSQFACDQVRNARRIQQSIRMGTLYLYRRDATLSSDNHYTYDTLKSEIEKAEKDGRIDLLTAGESASTIKHFRLGYSEVYIIDLSTGNGQPVVFHCTGAEKKPSEFITDTCNTIYLLPVSDTIPTSKLTISYSIFRKKIPNGSLLEADSLIRKHIADGIQKAQRLPK